jgi:hypothetical protein
MYIFLTQAFFAVLHDTCAMAVPPQRTIYVLIQMCGRRPGISIETSIRSGNLFFAGAQEKKSGTEMM